MTDVRVSDRVLPHSLDAEKSVLGAVLLHDATLALIAASLTANDFFRDAHRRIYSGMLRLWARQVPVDLATLREELTRAGDLDEVGGPAYITALVDGVPRSSHIEHYAQIVRDKAQLRALIYAANEIHTAAYGGDAEAGEVLAFAESRIYALGSVVSGGHLVDGATMAQEGQSFLDRRGTSTGLIERSTGLQALDRGTLGLHGGHLTVIAARPGQGKSAFMLHLARQLGMYAPLVVAVFSLEMALIELVQRMMASEGEIDGHRLNGSARFQDFEQRQLDEALSRIGTSRIFVDDTASRSITQIRSQCQRLLAQEGSLAAVCIDYLQLMTPVIGDRGESREQKVSAMAWGCKLLAKDLGVPVILLSQLSRAADASDRPQLSHLRESGAIEQHADDVWFVHPPSQEQDNGTCDIIVAKQRSGPLNTFIVGYDRTRFRFFDVDLHHAN